MDCDPRHFRIGFGATTEELKKGLSNFDAALAELMAKPTSPGKRQRTA